MLCWIFHLLRRGKTEQLQVSLTGWTQHLVASWVTMQWEISVPTVTSQRVDFENCHPKKTGEVTHRIQTQIIVDKHYLIIVWSIVYNMGPLKKERMHSTSTSPWNTLTMMTHPKCTRAAEGMSMFKNDVATMAKPNTLEVRRNRINHVSHDRAAVHYLQSAQFPDTPVCCKFLADEPSWNLRHYVPPEEGAVDHSYCFWIPVKLSFLWGEQQSQKLKYIVVRAGSQ